MNKLAIILPIALLVTISKASAQVAPLPAPILGIHQTMETTTEAIVPVEKSPDPLIYASPSKPIYPKAGETFYPVKIEGLAKIEHHWKRKFGIIPIRKTTYWYKIKGREKLHHWGHKLPVKDLRAYEEAHPIKHWIIETFDRWHPVTNSVGALGIPLLQVLKKNNGGL